ncbi:Sec-independent protein translocase protein TatB [Arenimonas sp. MALMAid1274]|uniref:Sec-independent protein translocase protein TatB n=1 Tax=Arenimonas sp. MALMAid1274 TaxID=3411630 RepID=UPI003B9E2DF2
MFDIGFSELLVIAVVALLVLGPERLPKAARFAGLWVRKARAQWYSVKSEFEREMAADEMKRSLSDPVQDLRRDLDGVGRDLGEVGRDVSAATREAEALARADGDAATAVLDIPPQSAVPVPDPSAVPSDGVVAPHAGDTTQNEASPSSGPEPEFYTDPPADAPDTATQMPIAFPARRDPPPP